MAVEPAGPFGRRPVALRQPPDPEQPVEEFDRFIRAASPEDSRSAAVSGVIVTVPLAPKLAFWHSTRPRFAEGLQPDLGARERRCDSPTTPVVIFIPVFQICPAASASLIAAVRAALWPHRAAPLSKAVPAFFATVVLRRGQLLQADGF